MAQSIRPRRTMLYMPGDNDRALEKAKTLAADALILDLEDSVAPDAKDVARDLVVAKVKAGGYGKREIIIRINAPETPAGSADMKAVIAAGSDAILVPKVEEAQTVRDLSSTLDALGADGLLKLWVMMETPLAMLHAEEIARTAKEPGSRLAGFVMGTNDLAKELFCAQTPDRLPMLTSLSLCLLAARAHGLAIVDGVHNDIADAEGFAAACRQGRDMGFDGKTIIHPKQIDPCNQAFRPDEAELAQARKFIQAFSLPENQGKGVVLIDGKMVERLHAEIAGRVVALADAIDDLERAA